MIRFFKSPQPVALIVIPLMVIILWAQIFLNCRPVALESSMPMWDLFSRAFNSLPSWLNFILLISLISGTAVYLNIVLNKHEVLYRNSYLPAFVYTLFISSIPAFLSLHPIHFVNILLIRVFDKSFSLFKNESPGAAIFDFSFLAGLACLFYFPAIVIIPLMIIAMLILRQWNFREWLIMFIGFGLPFFFVLVWNFWNKSLVEFVHNYSEHFKHIRPEWTISRTPALMAVATLFAIWLLLSLFKLRLNYLKNIVRTRSYQQIAFLMLIFFGGSILLSGKIQLADFAILAIPVAIFCSYYLVAAKKRIQFYELFLWMVIGAIVWVHLAV